LEEVNKNDHWRDLKSSLQNRKVGAYSCSHRLLLLLLLLKFVGL